MLTKLVYFAHPIDHVNGSGEAYESTLAARRALRQSGVPYYDPSRAWSAPPDTAPVPGLQRANLTVLAECDGVLAVLEPAVLSVGTVLEINKARAQYKPAVVYSRGMRPAWALCYLGVPVSDDPNEALTWLVEQMGGV